VNNTKAELALSLCHVGAYYRQRRGVFGKPFWALKDVSFNLYQGETLGIIGRNGVGKSTLLRLIADIVKPNRGEIINYGFSAALLCMQLGFIHYLTGRENAILSGMFMGLRKQEILSRLDDIIAFSELGSFIDQPVGTYSSGMVARLGFSVALQADPDILLIDEILGVGDAEFVHKSTQAMRERMRSHKTIVFVSHNSQMVEQLCDRVVWIEEGVSRAEGSPAEVIKQYLHFLELD
jgi:lipopolysaccharide transport system ATP-binding protein